MSRPASLPDFAAPPLNEIVLGVQFDQIPDYGLINAGEVWELYKDQYPKAITQPPSPPQFETFGSRPAPNFQVQFGDITQHPRFWFLQSDEHELLQFEPTRMFHNWRQLDGVGGVYPRYEYLAERFHRELSLLNQFALDFGKSPLLITQAEITYINRLYLGDDDRDWPFSDLNFVSLPASEVEAGGGAFQKVLTDQDGPVARIYVEFGTNWDTTGQPFIVFSHTVRGAPRKPGIIGALEFLASGRQVIVESFANLTTEKAHKKWQRTQ
ncbi:TIGR04255 family protein [Devosia sp. YIM 151766]|uniref:TIGR04255 family protein n=1 Tax=Devosia sp. YIM 151766 TaxID=3017325 RepID=UPI00255C3657|nr:TIGR04255 family protein [Devosia sp. YIM 151766]WIY54120.1 TIGR04255 family protein [Devosia sp. YIM 151766]